MNSKKIALHFVVMCMLLSFTACSKKCTNGCGNVADTDCMAEMCDNCCEYWMGLNGCYTNH